MQYHYPSAELMVTCAGPDIYRLNLERGQFLQPFTTAASELTACAVNTDTGLVLVRTQIPPRKIVFIELLIFNMSRKTA